MMYSGPSLPAKADFEQVALRPRHSPYPMLPVERAMEIILQNVIINPPTEIDQLQGRAMAWGSMCCKVEPWPGAAYVAR